VPTVWYLDTSAFVKLVRQEPESGALLEWLADREICSSDLLRTEARRAVAGEPEPARRLTEALLGSITLIRLTPEVFDQAGRLAGTLRSLDAIHIAAATQLGGDLGGLATYDQRMTAAVGRLGILAVSP
jgi:uncharacterized protein